MNQSIPESVFEFLLKLKNNNNREWMQANKKTYLFNEKLLKEFYQNIEKALNRSDEIANIKVYRIHRDIRFSNDKTPYNVHRSASFSRAGSHRRGGYYLRLEPGNSYMAGGFFNPNAADLFRIRKEFEIDSSEIRKILSQPDFKKAFGNLNQENLVKTAPNGFNKNDENIDLIRLKSFFVRHHFSDSEVHEIHFMENLIYHYELLRPFFDYMSEVLTTDLNGVSLLE